MRSLTTAFAMALAVTVVTSALAKPRRDQASTKAVPEARNQPTAVYDAAARGMFLFGGWQYRDVLGDAWIFRDGKWEPGQAGPEARGSHAMAYDARRHATVLFGGENGQGFLADTWVHSRGTWMRQSASGPAARSAHRMVFDSKRNRVVMFGGLGDAQKILGDTWEWEGREWKLVAEAGPAPRFHHGMVFDAARGVTIVLGGKPSLGRGVAPRSDMWQWDGTRWSEVKVELPPALDHVAMAFDAARREVVAFGGGDGKHHVSSTWIWNGKSWRLQASGPSARAASALVYDRDRRRLLLYGGTGPEGDLTDLWEWDGAKWRPLE